MGVEWRSQDPWKERKRYTEESKKQRALISYFCDICNVFISSEALSWIMIWFHFADWSIDVCVNTSRDLCISGRSCFRQGKLIGAFPNQTDRSWLTFQRQSNTKVRILFTTWPIVSPFLGCYPIQHRIDRTFSYHFIPEPVTWQNSLSDNTNSCRWTQEIYYGTAGGLL